MLRLLPRAVFGCARIAGCLLLAMAWAGDAAPAERAVTDKEQSKVYYAEARALIDKGRLAHAVIELKNALKNDPDNLAARYLLGELYVRLGDGVAAEKELREARQRGLDEAPVLVTLGRAYLLQGKYDQVLDEIRSADGGDEIEAGILLLRAQAYVGLDRLEEATEAFEGVARMWPDDPRPKVAMARLWIEKGDLAAAEEQANAALTLAPRVADVWVLMGQLRRLNGDLEVAIGHFDTAIEIDPRSLAGRLERAALLIDLERDDEAKIDIDAARQVAPDHPLALYLSALLAAKQKNYRAAEDALLQALRTLEGHLPSIFLLGVVTYAQDEFDAAAANLSKYLKADPDHAAARKLLGAALIRKNEPVKAIEVLLPVLQLVPNDRQTLALLGSAYMQNRLYSEGTRYLERAAAAAPQAATDSTQLMLSRQAIGGESESGAADRELAAEPDPLEVQASILLTLSQLRNRDYDAALAAATALVRILPGNPLGYNLRATATLGKGNVGAARSDYEKALEIEPHFVPAQLNLARLDLREGNTEGARKRLEAILERDSGNAGALIALAELAVGEGRSDVAVSRLESARRADPRGIAPRLHLLNLYLRMREGAKALAVAREIERIASPSPQTLDAIARAQIAAGEAQRAVATYRRLVELLPNSGEGYHRLAAAQAAAKDQAGSRESLRTATSVEPGYLPGWVSLIELELRAKRPGEALKLAAALRNERPDSAIGDMLAGDVMMRVENFSDAADAYLAAMEKENSAALARRLYSAHMRAGDADAALAVLEDWVAANPDDRATQRDLAGAYLKARRYEPAIEHHLRLLESDSDDPMILRNLARAYGEVGDPRALSYAEKAYAIAPQSVQVLDTLGWILVRRRQTARGLDLLAKARALAPREPVIGYHVAAALAALGRRDEARLALKNILESGTPFDAADEARALLRKLSGD